LEAFLILSAAMQGHSVRMPPGSIHDIDPEWLDFQAQAR